MKNASQILDTLQHKPQFSKLIESKCISRLKSSLLLSIQHNIKYGYIKNNILYFVLTTKLNKLDIDNIINTIKMILNSPMILESEKFLECLNSGIEDVIIYTNPKPQQKIKLFTTDADKTFYKEEASGDIQIDMEDKKLEGLFKEVFKIIKKNQPTTPEE
ncbi:MAG: hypothetical protein U9P38_03760 [Campylobacterota bacterium]|nr:hypothetical protein [Campylobacterota bacterium]